MGQQHNQPGYTDQSLIRNFCIIAHIDHGKSTVADRILQLSGIVPEREMRDRFLDRMDIEQERGITIKSQAVRVPWTVDGTEYTLGMIDTPGHVDFTYEVSRALAACEGAVLLVELLQVVIWFNPLVYLYKRAIRTNHEYLADEHVIDHHQNVNYYQHLLLDTIFRKNTPSLVSNIGYSLTKKRLIMMTKKVSSPWVLGKMALVIPVMAGLVLLFASVKESKAGIQDKSQTKTQTA